MSDPMTRRAALVVVLLLSGCTPVAWRAQHHHAPTFTCQSTICTDH